MSDEYDYGDDETLQEVLNTRVPGGRGETRGKRDLNQRAMSIVAQTVARYDEDQPGAMPIVLEFVGEGVVLPAAQDSTSMAGTDVTDMISV